MDFASNVLRKNIQLFKLSPTIKKCVVTPPQGNFPIDTNTLILWASHDEIFPLQNIDEFKKYINNPTVKVLEEYHDWLLFKPELLLEQLNK